MAIFQAQLSLLDINQRIFDCRQPGSMIDTGTFQTVSGTLYCWYLGKTSISQTFNTLTYICSTPGSGTVVAEAGLFSSPAAPNRTGQTLTCLTNASFNSTLTGGGFGTSSTLSGNSVPAGTHLWAGVRTALTTTQPTFSGAYAGDNGQGAILTRTGSVAIAVSTTYAMSVPTAAVATSNLCPRMPLTLD